MTDTIEQMAADLSELLGTRKSFLVSGRHSELIRAFFNALETAFIGDDSAIVLCIALDKTRTDALRFSLSQLNSDIQLPQIQVTTPQVLEKLMSMDLNHFMEMAALCKRYVIWLRTIDFEDQTFLHLLHILKSLPASPAITFMTSEPMPENEILRTFPGIQSLKYPLDPTGMTPFAWFFDDHASPEDVFEPEFKAICKHKKSIVSCRIQAHALRYAEASHRAHTPVIPYDQWPERLPKSYQFIAQDPLSEFHLPEAEWSHCVDIDPLPTDRIAQFGDAFLTKQNPVSILATNAFSLLTSIATTEYPCTQSAEPAHPILEIYNLFSDLNKYPRNRNLFNSDIANACLDFWIQQGLVSCIDGNIELTAACARLFPGIQDFSQLGILHGYCHNTQCQAISHDDIGLIPTNFLLTNAHFSLAGKFTQRHFHNKLNTEATLRLNSDPAYPVWLDASPVLCSPEITSNIEKIIFSDAPCQHIHLSSKCAEILDDIQRKFNDAPAHHFIETSQNCAQWWTFAGAQHNAFLAMLITAIAPRLRISYGNCCIRLSWAQSPCSCTTKIARRLQEITNQIRDIAQHGLSPEMRASLWKSWKSTYVYSALFALVPESIQHKCFDIEWKQWAESFDSSTIPVIECDPLHAIDDALPLQFEELPPVQPTSTPTGPAKINTPPAPKPTKQTTESIPYRSTPIQDGIMHTRYPWTYVDSSTKLAKALNIILAQDFIGLDVETTLYDQRLCLIQIGCSDQSFLIDPLSVDFSGLEQVFAHPNIIKVIHNATFETNVLKKYGIPIINIVDTLKVSRKLYGMRCPGGHSLKAVCKREFGLEMSKECQTSRWEVRPLSDEQLEYAALDAEILIHLYRHFFMR